MQEQSASIVPPLQVQVTAENPACKLFVSTEAGGVGVNLQVASTVIMADMPWNPAKLQQRIGRLNRIGQKNTVTCINLVARGTIEEHILEVLSEKTDLFRKVVDGDFSGSVYESARCCLMNRQFAEQRRMEAYW